MSTMTESFRLIGAKVEIDKGDGSLSTLTTKDLPESIIVRGTLDGFGVREATFGWHGGPSPATTAVLRAARRVKVTGIRGILGEAIESTVLTDGKLRDADYSVHPPLSTLTSQDQLLGLDKPLFYTKDLRDLKSRDEIITAILTDAGITKGTFTWPAGFTDGGGYCVKEINEAGGRTVGQFLAEFIAPTGCRMYQRSGALYIKAFSTTDTPANTLPLSLIRSLRVTPPSTSTPNVVSVTAGNFAYRGADLTASSPVTSTVEVAFDAGAGHVVRVAYEKQDKTTGAITAVSPSSSPGSDPWSRVVTDTYYEGGTVVRRVVSTYGWKAPIAAPTKVSSGGVSSHNDLFDCFHYTHDGSWRTQEAETFQLISQVTTERWFDGDGFLVTEREITADFRQIETYNATIANGANTETAATRYVIADGRALRNAKEELSNNEIVLTSHVRNSFEIGRTNCYSYQQIMSTAAGTSPPREPYPIVSYTPGATNNGPTIYVFGPTAGKRYARLWANAGIDPSITITIAYAVVTDTSHTQTTTKVTPDSINGTGYASRWAAYTAGGVTLSYRIPRPEMHTDAQVPEPYTYTIKDDVGIQLNGGVEIVEYVQNDWCEWWWEQKTLAIERLRQLRALRVTIETDADFELDEGDVVTIPAHPAFSFEDAACLIVEQEANLNLSTAANSHMLTCFVYPKELTVMSAVFSVEIP
jgi:hypothetical protein